MFLFAESVERLREQLKDKNNPPKMAGIDKYIVVDNSLILFWDEGKTIRAIKIIDDVAKTLMMIKTQFKVKIDPIPWFDRSLCSEEKLIEKLRTYVKYM